MRPAAKRMLMDRIGRDRDPKPKQEAWPGHERDGEDHKEGYEPAMAGHKAEHDAAPAKLDRATAQRWVASMENADGTKGPHWTQEQTDRVMEQSGYDCDKLEFWVAMNMMYSDYCQAVAEGGSNTVDFYAKLAKAFLTDKDAKKGKLARYYRCIAK